MKLSFGVFTIVIFFTVTSSYGEVMNQEQKRSVDEAHLLFAKQANGETATFNLEVHHGFCERLHRASDILNTFADDYSRAFQCE